jgi:hypothetical protein
MAEAVGQMNTSQWSRPPLVSQTTPPLFTPPLFTTPLFTTPLFTTPLFTTPHVGETPPLIASRAVEPVAVIIRPLAMMVEPTTGRLLTTVLVMSTSSVCTVTLH